MEEKILLFYVYFLEILVSFKKKKEYKSYKAYFLMSTIIFSVSIIN